MWRNDYATHMIDNAFLTSRRHSASIDSCNDRKFILLNEYDLRSFMRFKFQRKARRKVEHSAFTSVAYSMAY